MLPTDGLAVAGVAGIESDIVVIMSMKKRRSTKKTKLIHGSVAID
jgi:hypothetical protein